MFGIRRMTCSGYVVFCNVITFNQYLLTVVLVDYHAEFVGPSAKGQSIQFYTDTGVVVGVFLGGLVAGVLIVLLVVGIVCGVCTLIPRKPHPKPPATKLLEPDNK